MNISYPLYWGIAGRKAKIAPAAKQEKAPMISPIPVLRFPPLDSQNTPCAKTTIPAARRMNPAIKNIQARKAFTKSNPEELVSA